MEKNKKQETQNKSKKGKKRKKNFPRNSSIKWNQFPRNAQEERSNYYKFTLA